MTIYYMHFFIFYITYNIVQIVTSKAVNKVSELAIGRALSTEILNQPGDVGEALTG